MDGSSCEMPVTRLEMLLNAFERHLRHLLGVQILLTVTEGLLEALGTRQQSMPGCEVSADQLSELARGIRRSDFRL